MAELEIGLADEAATHGFGVRLAEQLRAGDVVLLSGPLGAGKTSLARGILAGLGARGEVPSPTFAIVIPYDPPDVRLPLWHVDLYRLDDPDDVAELGLDEARQDGALVIEWPERLGESVPADGLALCLQVDPAGGRRLTCHLPAAWRGRWPHP